MENDRLYQEYLRQREKTESLSRNFLDIFPVFERDDPDGYMQACSRVSISRFQECVFSLSDEDRKFLRKWSLVRKTPEANLFADRLIFLERSAYLSRVFSDERLLAIKSSVEKRMRHADTVLSFDGPGNYVTSGNGRGGNA